MADEAAKITALDGDFSSSERLHQGGVHAFIR
jgi:hypothetical protein